MCEEAPADVMWFIKKKKKKKEKEANKSKRGRKQTRRIPNTAKGKKEEEGEGMQV